MTQNTARSSGQNTIDPAEIERFSAIADEWWDPQGKFRPLHQLNPVRLQYIRDEICRHFGKDSRAPSPLAGLEILDIGCGGGLLSSLFSYERMDLIFLSILLECPCHSRSRC